MNTQVEKMTANDLFLIKNALHLLAEKTQKELMNGDALANRVFDEIVEPVEPAESLKLVKPLEQLELTNKPDTSFSKTIIPKEKEKSDSNLQQIISSIDQSWRFFLLATSAREASEPERGEKVYFFG